MGKPTDEQLKQTLAKAAEMREHGKDSYFLVLRTSNSHFLVLTTAIIFYQDYP
jgi:hypothetical protein